MSLLAGKVKMKPKLAISNPNRKGSIPHIEKLKPNQI